MKKLFGRLIIPAVLAVFAAAPAIAQVRLGVDLGNVRIRIAPDAPPRPRFERRMPRPGPNHLWIAGYWDRQGDQWAWSNGRWEEPNRRGARWVRPVYRREYGAYRYVPGRWSHQQVEEGDDYRNWRRDRDKSRGHGRGRDNDRRH
jgi:hypothetical protein